MAVTRKQETRLSDNQGLLRLVRGHSRGVKRRLNDGRLGLIHGHNGEVGPIHVLAGRSREVGRLDGRLLLRLLVMVAGALDQGLGLGRVVAHVLLGHLGGVLGALLGNRAELGRLSANNLAGVLELGVNELLVGGVDEWGEEDDRGGDDGQAPVGDDLDEVVRDKSSEGGLWRVGGVSFAALTQ